MLPSAPLPFASLLLLTTDVQDQRRNALLPVRTLRDRFRRVLPLFYYPLRDLVGVREVESTGYRGSASVLASS